MIVNLVGYEPPARTDNILWEKAVIQSAAASSGPWATLTEVVLSPADTDATNPAVRNFSINDVNATETTWYQVYFVDTGGAPSLPSTPITGAYRVTYLPALHEIGSLARTRTKTDAGEIGTFTTQTRPTSSEVRDLIRQAGNDVAAKIGYAVPANVLEGAKNVVKLRTVMLIELSYFAEQVQANRSPYEQYKALYDLGIADIEEAVAESEYDNAIDVDYAGMPSYGGFDTCGNSTSMTDDW